MTASSRQEGGNHYTGLPEHAQPWNVLQHWLTPEEYRGWQKGNAIVYLARERQKGGDTDVRKASHHLERLIEEFPGEAETEIPVSPSIDALPVVEMPPQPDADGWIEWKGGECPVGLFDRVDVKSTRHGILREGALAADVRWDNAFGFYRLHKPAEPEKAAATGMRGNPAFAADPHADPHAELRKTWKPGQLWQWQSADGSWCDMDPDAEPTCWAPLMQYRRHPDDVAGAQV